MCVCCLILPRKVSVLFELAKKSVSALFELASVLFDLAKKSVSALF